MPKTTNITSHFNEILITITLNFEYYEKNGKELHTIESKEPENSREAILLHELQHVLQACHNRSSGTETTKGISKANARMDALRHLELSKKITKMEKAEYIFYKSLKKNLLYDFFYYDDEGEREARLVVQEIPI